MTSLKKKAPAKHKFMGSDEHVYPAIYYIIYSEILKFFHLEADNSLTSLS